VEPVEINAGEYYLRQLRADKHLDDRPALVAAFADPTHRKYVLNYRLRDLDEATERDAALRHAESSSGLRRTIVWAGSELILR
jgi:hypothetical protein